MTVSPIAGAVLVLESWKFQQTIITLRFTPHKSFIYIQPSGQPQNTKTYHDLRFSSNFRKKIFLVLSKITNYVPEIRGPGPLSANYDFRY